ncbi:hypothetical protein WJX73_003711 [Symbiochloris irregularis]|uniref:Uncharacterized protein n=1 Tax=Symbiochloris irregularis TaxID=706552 RepID=A0AAW1Q388_9CHLO
MILYVRTEGPKVLWSPRTSVTKSFCETVNP